MILLILLLFAILISGQKAVFYIVEHRTDTCVSAFAYPNLVSEDECFLNRADGYNYIMFRYDNNAGRYAYW